MIKLSGGREFARAHGGDAYTYGATGNERTPGEWSLPAFFVNPCVRRFPLDLERLPDRDTPRTSTKTRTETGRDRATRKALERSNWRMEEFSALREIGNQ